MKTRRHHFDCSNSNCSFPRSTLLRTPTLLQTLQSLSLPLSRPSVSPISHNSSLNLLPPLPTLPPPVPRLNCKTLPKPNSSNSLPTSLTKFPTSVSPIPSIYPLQLLPTNQRSLPYVDETSSRIGYRRVSSPRSLLPSTTLPSLRSKRSSSS